MPDDVNEYAKDLGLDHAFVPGQHHPQFCGALDGTCGWGESFHEKTAGE